MNEDEIKEELNGPIKTASMFLNRYFHIEVGNKIKLFMGNSNNALFTGTENEVKAYLYGVVLAVNELG